MIHMLKRTENSAGLITSHEFPTVIKWENDALDGIATAIFRPW